MDLKAYTVSLINAHIIDISRVVTNSHGRITLNTPFAGVSVGTVWANEAEMQERLANALVDQYGRGSTGARVA